MLDVSTADLGEDSPAPALDSRVSDDASVDAPAMDVPLVDMAAVDVPVVDAPALDVPLVDMAAVDVPVVDAPAVDVSTSDVPVPVVDAPPVDAPAGCSAVPIGASGGTISCAGATFTVPPGALTTTVPIRITPTADAPPSGFTGYSRVFRFEPSGTTFATPVRVSIPFTGNPARATLFWSRATGTGYERVGGVVTGGTLTGTVTHFSDGFVGDGVDYSEAPDRSCTATRLIEGRTVSPSGVAMFFSAEDCVGRPLTGLTAADFVVREDGTPLTSESSVTLLSREGPTVFVSLVLDMSSSTRGFLPQLVAACRQFVTTLQVTRALPVQIDVQLFAGESSLTEWQAPTLDTTRLLARLDALPDYSRVLWSQFHEDFRGAPTRLRVSSWRSVPSPMSGPSPSSGTQRWETFATPHA